MKMHKQSSFHNLFLKPISSTRIMVRPAIRCSRCSPIPKQSSGLPLLSGLGFDGRLPRKSFLCMSYFIVNKQI
ncbi:MAG: hypothetical protein WCL14_10900 [Bacteroidota bacterium]